MIIVYSIPVQRLINQVYYCKERVMSREMVSIEVLNQNIYYTLDRTEKYLLNLFSTGYNYLIAESECGFMDMIYDDDGILEEDNSYSEYSRLALVNLINHFCCELALYLIDTTDIEDYFDKKLSLVNLEFNTITFHCLED